LSERFKNIPMKILHIISSINAQGGGPIEGVRQIGLKKIEMGQYEVAAQTSAMNQAVSTPPKKFKRE
jgi:hypothetical protein